MTTSPTASYTIWYHFHLKDCSERALLLAENNHADDKVRYCSGTVAMHRALLIPCVPRIQDLQYDIYYMCLPNVGTYSMLTAGPINQYNKNNGYDGSSGIPSERAGDSLDR